MKAGVINNRTKKDQSASFFA